MYRLALCLLPLSAALFLAKPDAKKSTEGVPVVFKGAKILTANGKPIEKGVLVVHKGKIVAVGAEGEVTIPSDVVVRDVAGKVIIPGLVDTHSHIGIWPRPHVQAHNDGNE